MQGYNNKSIYIREDSDQVYRKKLIKTGPFWCVCSLIQRKLETERILEICSRRHCVAISIFSYLVVYYMNFK